MTQSNPILVEVVRGDMAESFHRGACVVVDRAGVPIYAWGNVQALIYPHSSIKPIQAVLLVESGALDAFGLEAEEIAMACSSHTGSPEHLVVLERWLKKLKLTPEILECGAHAPLDPAVRLDLVRRGVPLTPIYHTCSGKHLAFITTCLHLGLPVPGYIHRSHPVQQLAERLFQDLAQYDLSSQPQGVDGCGLPVVALPLIHLAQAMANYGNPDFHTSERSQAVARVMGAMAKHPVLVGGTPKLCTQVLEVLKGQAILKDGNEGVYAAVIPHLGLGIALKIDDGSLKIADVVMANILDKMGILSDAHRADLKAFLNPSIANFAKTITGEIKSGL